MTGHSKCRFLYGGQGVGRWNSVQDSPFSNATSVFEPIFWFPEVNISQVAIDIKDIAELPARLRAIPAADIRRMQGSLAEAQPFFRYRCVHGAASICPCRSVHLAASTPSCKGILHVKYL